MKRKMDKISRKAEKILSGRIKQARQLVCQRLPDHDHEDILSGGYDNGPAIKKAMEDLKLVKGWN